MNYSCFLGDKSEAPRLDEKQHGGTSKSNALLQFETLATWNLQTPNRKLQFAVCAFPWKSLMLKRSLKSFVLLQTRGWYCWPSASLLGYPDISRVAYYSQLDNITSLYWFFLETRNLKGLQNVIRSSWKKTRERKRNGKEKTVFTIPESSRLSVREYKFGPIPRNVRGFYLDAAAIDVNQSFVMIFILFRFSSQVVLLVISLCRHWRESH